MVSKEDALKHLTLDRDYEDKLVSDISSYLLESVDNLKISNEDKEKIKIYLNMIRSDSERHSLIFSQMMDYVINNAKDRY